MPESARTRVALLVEDESEDRELTEPRETLRAAADVCQGPSS